MRTRLSMAGAALFFAGSFLLFYREILTKLVRDWGASDNYSHGFLIVPLALYFVWERRTLLSVLEPRPSLVGVVVVIGSLAVCTVGTLGAELFLMRISIVGVIAGSILFACGWAVLRVLAYPVLFLLLMIPLPAIVFNQIAFPLQLFASQVGETILSVLGIPVLREGNLIVLASTTLEVAEACSGIRSLMSLLTLALVYGYFIDHRTNVRSVIALSTVPIAIVSNAARVAGTGVVAHYTGPEAADGFFHTFSGWLVFMVGLILLVCVQGVLTRFFPVRTKEQSHLPGMEAA